MRVRNVQPNGARATAVQLGRTAGLRATGTVTVKDGNGNDVIGASQLLFSGASVTEDEEGGAIIALSASAIPNIEDLATSETNVNLVLKPDGAGGVEFVQGETPVDHGSMGATETIDAVVGTVHRGTLNADCIVTVTGFTAGEFAEPLYFEVAQNGIGGFTVDLDGGSNIVPIGDLTANAAALAVTQYVLFGMDGDALIYAAKVGGSSVSALDDLTDAQTTGEVAGVGLFFDGSTWRPGYAPAPLLLEDGTVAILEDGSAAMSEPTYI